MTTASVEQIHYYLGHPTLSVPSLYSIKEIMCEPCQFGKHSHTSFLSQDNKWLMLHLL